MKRGGRRRRKATTCEIFIISIINEKREKRSSRAGEAAFEIRSLAGKAFSLRLRRSRFSQFALDSSTPTAQRLPPSGKQPESINKRKVD